MLDLKIHFLIQEHKGWDVWRRQFTSLRIPLVFNLRSDPFERADESMIPFETSNQVYFIAPCLAVVSMWLESFRDFPVRQRPAKSNIDDIVRLLPLRQRDDVATELRSLQYHELLLISHIRFTQPR